jgi:hypothetical protein
LIVQRLRPLLTPRVLYVVMRAHPRVR